MSSELEKWLRQNRRSDESDLDTVKRKISEANEVHRHYPNTKLIHLAMKKYMSQLTTEKGGAA